MVDDDDYGYDDDSDDNHGDGYGGYDDGDDDVGNDGCDDGYDDNDGDDVHVNVVGNNDNDNNSYLLLFSIRSISMIDQGAVPWYSCNLESSKKTYIINRQKIKSDLFFPSALTSKSSSIK